MTSRILLLSACFLAGAALMAGGHRGSVIPPRESLSDLPMRIGGWYGRVQPELSKEVLDMLRVDDYTDRFYFEPNGAAVGLYIGYHLGGGFHSPLNCLPGSGWIPVQRSLLEIPVQSSPAGHSPASIRVNRIVILKGLEEQVVLYWYQGCGRVIASEYWGLIYGIIDKMRLGRTDAALVRILSPMQSRDPAAAEAATRRAVGFAQLIYPMLNRYIPD
jgi:EpsI family protein